MKKAELTSSPERIRADDTAVLFLLRNANPITSLTLSQFFFFAVKMSEMGDGCETLEEQQV